MKVEGFHIGVSDLDAFGVDVGIQLALDSKSGFGGGRGDQLNNRLVTDERPTAPVLCDEREEPVLASRGGDHTLRALRTVLETLTSHGSHQANGTLRPVRQCMKRPVLLSAIRWRNVVARVLRPLKRLNFRITHARSV